MVKFPLETVGYTVNTSFPFMTSSTEAEAAVNCQEKTPLP
jgi:hypothetical protein